MRRERSRMGPKCGQAGGGGGGGGEEVEMSDKLNLLLY